MTQPMQLAQIQQQAELAPIIREQRNRVLDDLAMAGAINAALHRKLADAEVEIKKLKDEVEHYRSRQGPGEA